MTMGKDCYLYARDVLFEKKCEIIGLYRVVGKGIVGKVAKNGVFG